ncbi:MAG: aconitase X [Methanomicrobiales archaeon]
MELDDDDQQILDGEYGETRAMMLEMLVALGTVYGAKRLIPIASAQVSGASYKTIGRWGLSWLQGLDARAVVPAVLNPIGMPRDEWREMGGISREFAEKQEAVLRAYRRLGIALECTCTPYEIRIIEYGDHLAWSESSAVSYANSVIGARTNREGGPAALAAALIGKTPEYGLHILENRRPEVVVSLTGMSERLHSFGALGHVAGEKIGTRIPVFTGIRPKRDELKALGAAMAATGTVPLYHVEGITPEARVFEFGTGDLDRITIDAAEVDALFEEIAVDAVAVGCPHLSPAALEDLARLLQGKTVTRPLYVFAARGVIQAHRETVRAIERSGARVYPDTCMVVSPAMEQFDAVMVDSGKAFSYLPEMVGARARIGTLTECVAVATS